MVNKVYIGVGHGGDDSGASHGGLRESDLNLPMGFIIQAELQRCGVDTKISRTSDITFPTASKVVDANSWGADLVIDVHHNAGGGVGFEVYRSQIRDGSEALAQDISDEMDAIGRKNRGVKTDVRNGIDYFGIIRETKAPAVLLEYGFMDNAADVKLITDPVQQLAWAQATAKGICTTLGMEYIPEGGGTLHRVQVGAFKEEANARAYLATVLEMGLEAFLVAGSDGLWRVQVGAFRGRANAENHLALVKGQGFDAFIVEAA